MMRRFVAKALTLVISASLAVLIAAGAKRNAGGEHARGARHEEDSRRSRLAWWVELGPNGQAIARAITSHADCPFIELDHARHRMSLRAGPETIPQRPTASSPQDSKPSEFPVRTCEYSIPEGTQVARITVEDEEGEQEEPEARAFGHDDSEFSTERSRGHLLPLPKRNPRRIVILGDTGCRLKIGDPWQACSDTKEWPLQTIAETAVRFKPDLVLHVGDYHYRENQCPPDIGGCQDSPWGYGWDTWDADLFKPAAKLLAAAPWIMVRGNHEECARAGQGWYRFLDTQPYKPIRTCNDPANDAIANYNDPYAVPIGDDAQIIVFDSSKVSKTKLAPTDAAFANYQDELHKVAALAAAKPDALSIWTNHHPLLAFSPLTGTTVTGGNPALLSVMYATYGTAYYPPGIGLVLHGHTHILEAVNYSTKHPPTFVIGNGGDNLDINLPDPFPSNAHPDGAFASAVDVEEIAHTSTFGFVVADRGIDGTWTFRVYTRQGRLLTTCEFAAAKTSCSQLGFLH
ncbi:MAG TPA: metallophosphoesterase [Candidatus Acidoferrales bacterium]|nr:metallophosphoesterase [Candidatus Acidoferrales bacterium]